MAKKQLIYLQESKLNKKIWFQSWVLKIARAFGLDAVQGSNEARMSRTMRYGERAPQVADATMRQEDWRSLGFAQSRPARPKVSRGFTIIELLLATVIFSGVVVVALSGFLTIGRLFYKGVNLSQTQATAQQIVDNVITDIQAASTVWDTLPPASGGRSYVCVGNYRYIYKLHNLVDISAHDNTQNFGLLRDRLPGGNSACPNPYEDVGLVKAVAPINPSEMLGNKMRLNSFSVTRTCPTCKLYAINVNLAYGDDSSLDIDPVTNIATCNSNLASSQYCTVTGLSTTVAGGL